MSSGEKRLEQVVNFLEELEKAVRGYGEVTEEYGGYAIRIIDGARFPWTKVCNLLLSANHEVWIERRNGDLYIISKPITD